MLFNINNCYTSEEENMVCAPQTGGGVPVAKKQKNRKYDDSYLDYGFTSICINDEVRPQCVLCGKVLAKSNMLPSKLKRHLYTNHSDVSGLTREYFAEKLKEMKQEGDQEDTIENASGVEDNGELGFGYGMNPVAALEHSDTEPSGSANSFTVNKRQKLEHRVSTLKHAVNELKNRPMSHTNQSEENEFDIFGLYVSTSLKKLSLPRAFRLQEKINSLIAEERISYASQTSPYSNNGMAAINHRSDNDDMDHSSESSYITDRQNDIKAEEIEIECVPEIRLSL